MNNRPLIPADRAFSPLTCEIGFRTQGGGDLRRMRMRRQAKGSHNAPVANRLAVSGYKIVDLLSDKHPGSPAFR
jgi:hypothetical protein